MAKYLATSFAMENVVSDPRGDEEWLGDLDDFDELGRVGVKIDHVAGLFGRLRAGVHREADVSLRERWRVIGAIAGHRHHVPAALLTPDQRHLLHAARTARRRIVGSNSELAGRVRSFGGRVSGGEATAARAGSAGSLTPALPGSSPVPDSSSLFQGQVVADHQKCGVETRTSGRGGNAAPPFRVSRLSEMVRSEKLGCCEDGVQVPGVPRTGAGQRAQPHVRVCPRRVEPDPGVAASAVPRRAGPDELHPGQRLPDRHGRPPGTWPG